MYEESLQYRYENVCVCQITLNTAQYLPFACKYVFVTKQIYLWRRPYVQLTIIHHVYLGTSKVKGIEGPSCPTVRRWKAFNIATKKLKTKSSFQHKTKKKNKSKVFVSVIHLPSGFGSHRTNHHVHSLGSSCSSKNFSSSYSHRNIYECEGKDSSLQLSFLHGKQSEAMRGDER